MGSSSIEGIILKHNNRQDSRKEQKRTNQRKVSLNFSGIFARIKNAVINGVSRFFALMRKVLSVLFNIRVLLGVLLLQIVLMFSYSLANDIFLMGKNEYEIAENKYPDEAFVNELVVIVQEVNPNTGVIKFDIKFVTDDPKFLSDDTATSKIEVILDSGSVLLSDNKLLREYESILHRVHMYLDTPEIFGGTNLKQAIYEKNGLTVKIGQERRGFLYPFDKYFLQFNFILLDNEAKPIRTLVSFQSNDPHFLHTRPVANLTYGQGVALVPDSLAIFFERPTHQKILFIASILLALIITLWSLLRVSSATLNLTETVEILALNITVILAVPDLRGLLVPTNLQFAPLFDFSVVTIWVLSLLTLAIYVFKNSRRESK